MDYAKTFTYVFEEDDWISKFLIGVVVSFIPIVNFASYGYLVQLLKNVRDGEKHPLPEWDEFGKLFFDGLKVFVGMMVYFLPVLLLSFLAILLAALAGEEPGAFFGLSITAVSCLIVFFSFVPMIIMPAALVQFAKEDHIGDMFAFSEMKQIIMADLGTYVIILLFLAIVLSVVSSVGLIACGIGVLFTAWYAYLVGGHLLGQYAQELPGAEKSA